MDKTVIGIHREKDEWALLVAASRKPDGSRFITPFLLVSQHSPLFAICPGIAAWSSAGYIRVLHTALLKDAQREGILDNAIDELLQEIKACSDVLQTARTGVTRNFLSAGFSQPLDSFAMGGEPAFRWLCTSRYGNTAHRAMQALKLARQLAAKHGLDKPTQDQRERKGTKLLLGGYRGKPVF